MVNIETNHNALCSLGLASTTARPEAKKRKDKPTCEERDMSRTDRSDGAARITKKRRVTKAFPVHCSGDLSTVSPHSTQTHHTHAAHTRSITVSAKTVRLCVLIKSHPV